MKAEQRQLLTLLAHVFLRHGQNDKALKLLRAGSRLALDDAEIHKCLAYAELVSGHPGEALEAIGRFAAAGGDDGSASPVQIIRAKALLQLDRRAEARDCFRRFVEAHAPQGAARPIEIRPPVSTAGTSQRR
jgi:type III secretion protein Y